MLMKGIFGPYVLWPFDKKLIFWIVTRVSARDYTVFEMNRVPWCKGRCVAGLPSYFGVSVEAIFIVFIFDSTGDNPYHMKEMVFCDQNWSDLLWEKIVLVIEKNFWNAFLTCSWKFLLSNKLEQLEFKLEKNIGI